MEALPCKCHARIRSDRHFHRIAELIKQVRVSLRRLVVLVPEQLPNLREAHAILEAPRGVCVAKVMDSDVADAGLCCRNIEDAPVPIVDILGMPEQVATRPITDEPFERRFES